MLQVESSAVTTPRGSSEQLLTFSLDLTASSLFVSLQLAAS